MLLLLLCTLTQSYRNRRSLKTKKFSPIFFSFGGLFLKKLYKPDKKQDVVGSSRYLQAAGKGSKSHDVRFAAIQ